MTDEVLLGATDEDLVVGDRVFQVWMVHVDAAVDDGHRDAGRVVEPCCCTRVPETNRTMAPQS